MGKSAARRAVEHAVAVAPKNRCHSGLSRSGVGMEVRVTVGQGVSVIVGVAVGVGVGQPFRDARTAAMISEIEIFRSKSRSLAEHTASLPSAMPIVRVSSATDTSPLPLQSPGQAVRGCGESPSVTANAINTRLQQNRDSQRCDIFDPTIACLTHGSVIADYTQETNTRTDTGSHTCPYGLQGRSFRTVRVAAAQAKLA